jgi:predicted esterase
MRTELRWALGLSCAGAVALAIAVAATRGSKRARAGAPTDAAFTDSPAVADAPAVAAEVPPALPRRVRRDSVRVPLDAGRPSEAFWQMHESEPLVVPDEEPRPVTVLLHGMCADSSWTCDWLQYFDMRPQWQVCPRAPGRCRTEPGYSWTGGAATRRVVELALSTLKQRHGARVRDDSVVIAGFSQGAYALAGLVHELALRPSPSIHVRGILAQGAHVHFTPADVRALGVRVALTAGDLDGAEPAMRAEAEQLARAGVEARFASLGRDEGHFTSVSTGRTVAQLIDWCRGAED